MVVKTYGKIIYNKESKKYEIVSAQPHVCIKLKALFTGFHKYEKPPFIFIDSPENCNNLHWFMQRYPLEISDNDLARMKRGKNKFINKINELEAITAPDYVPTKLSFKNGKSARNYQLQHRDLYWKCKRLLNVDDIGLGKTLEAIITCDAHTLPALVVVQTHMPQQYKGAIEEYTDLRVHIIKGTTPYNLPPADIYISKYSCLAGWINFFQTKFYKMAVFDEVQELRHDGTGKYQAAMELSINAKYAGGYSATPIYNFGDEMYNILNAINPGCLGDRESFLREWTNDGRTIKDTAAFGTYLRENFLMLRRTREEVGRELPPVNILVQTVAHDDNEVKNAQALARELAIKVTSGSFVERGQAARELDMLVRHNTGVAKARGVAEFVKIILENNEPVILAGWHRDVYDIWLEELKEYNPVMYTGTETAAQKEKAKQDFIDGKTNLFIISLRSGVGLDGLQFRCKMVVIGELDWSPKVHEQLIGRVDRDRGDEPGQQVTAIYLTSNCGSDPLIIDLLGLKSSQSHGILNPLMAATPQHSDESRIKLLAQQYLDKKTTEKLKLTESK